MKSIAIGVDKKAFGDNVVVDRNAEPYLVDAPRFTKIFAAKMLQKKWKWWFIFWRLLWHLSWKLFPFLETRLGTFILEPSIEI
ncbi:hypothetical protein ACS0Y6_32045, partial [Burkholderia gladioli]|uniref:hypothetical protein n=1 Tax=Burkholderia gladioli TaxID=28095 RepID=UPI003F78EF42